MSYANEAVLVALGGIFAVIPVPIIIGRFIIHWRHGIKWDDWLCIAAWVGMVVCFVIVLLGTIVIKINGGDMALFGDASFFRTSQLFHWKSSALIIANFNALAIVTMLIQTFEWLFQSLWLTTMAALKISSLLFYQRVAGRNKLAIALMLVVGTWYISFGAGMLAANGSVNGRYFGIVGAVARRLGSVHIFTIMSVLDVLLNAAIMALYTVMLCKSRGPSKYKIAGGICVIVALVTMIFGIIRTAVYGQLGTFNFSNKGLVDGTMATSIVRSLIFWGTVEMGFAFITVNLPVFKRILGEDYSIYRNSSRKVKF